MGSRQRAREEATRAKAGGVRHYEIRWIDLPDPVGARPVLLLSRSSAAQVLGRILVAEVTTTIRGIPQEVALGPREGLSRKCVANLDAARSVPTSRIRERIGTLRASRHVEVKRAMGHALAWPELSSLS
jgi:mRNA interferase MazF